MMRTRRDTGDATHPGFTLIELLVVLSIIGLLTSFLLPAIQSARESAWRARCAANLRQIGIALATYESTNRTFPINWRDDLKSPFGKPRNTMARPFSSLARILPHLEQQSLHSAINYDVQTSPDNTDPVFPFHENRTAFETTLSIFLCPSDLKNEPTSYGCNYRGNFGVGPAPGTTYETRDSGNGFYTLGAVLSPSSFPDGLSHTVAYCERLRGTGTRSTIAPERDFGDINVARYCTERDADYALMCSRVASAKDFPVFRLAGFTWFLGDFECTAYSHAQEPNGIIPDAISRNSWDGIVTARSMHIGGVNSLMADGAVRMVRGTIARQVWRALGTRNGDELVE